MVRPGRLETRGAALPCYRRAMKFFLSSRPSRVLAVACAVAVASGALLAQQSDAVRTLDAQIQRIFTSNEYELPRFGPARWLDGRTYTTVERAGAPASGSEIVRYDAVSGSRSVLVPAARLTPPGANAALTVADYVWSGDGKKLLIFTNTRRV